MDLDSPKLAQCIKELKTIDFELAYLAALAAEGTKPLSRWEKPLDDNALTLLARMDLLTARVTRSVKTGERVTETLFGRSPAYIDLYRRRFDSTPIDKSPRTQLAEGYLFGYPPCCITAYIRRPYAPNNIDPQDQKIIFHWACPKCRITPILLPAYRTIHQLIENS